jgi:DNA-binding LytR/AlgR family response regulator
MLTESSKAGNIYRDIIFFIVAIPIINAFNYCLTYTKISFNSHTLLTFLIDTVEGYAAWWVIRTIIVYLNRKLPYSPNPIKRIAIQLVLTTVAALSLIIIATESINAAAKDTPVPASFYRLDIFIFMIWSLVINGVYVGLHYYVQFEASENLRRQEKQVRQEGFTVKKGKQYFNVLFADIAGIYIEGNYATLITTDGKKHLLDESLDAVERQLPLELFFRLSRKYIMNRNMITGFERVEHSKLNILLAESPHFPRAITMSRLKAPAFKAWFLQA